MSEGECIRAVFLRDSSIVLEIEPARLLFSKGFYGMPIGVEKPKDASFNSPLRLSLFETIYLAEKKMICLRDVEGNPIDIIELKTRLLRDEKTRNEYIVYKSLRDSGLIVRSGLRYGSDFTVYRLGPGLEHAPFIVNVHDINDEIDPLDIVKAQRVSHSVRKTLTLALVSDDESVNYLSFRWVRL